MNIAVYEFNGQNVRTVETKGGETLWVAKDVCDCLEIANARDAVADFDEDELVSVKATSGGQLRDMNCVTEAGLYQLIFKSRKEAAKAFKRWVTHEVLPSLRKTGRYEMGKSEQFGDEDLPDFVEQNLNIPIDEAITKIIEIAKAYNYPLKFKKQASAILVKLRVVNENLELTNKYKDGKYFIETKARTYFRERESDEQIFVTPEGYKFLLRVLLRYEYEVTLHKIEAAEEIRYGKYFRNKEIAKFVEVEEEEAIQESVYVPYQ